MVHLVESNGKKAAFLRAAQQLTQAPAIVHQERMEEFGKRFTETVDVVTARAILPLHRLMLLCYPLLGKTRAHGLFPKGQNVDLELNEAKKTWNMDAVLVPSRTQAGASIVVVRDLSLSRGGRKYNYKT
jgi:16S rRNA (guanine527-N7)-methyltransferase